MEINASGRLLGVSLPFLGRKPSTAAATTTAPEKADVALSPLAQYTFSRQIQSLSISQNQTSLTVATNGIQLRTNCTLNTSMQRETYRLEVVFSAEALGLDAAVFSQSGGKPLRFQFAFSQTRSTMIKQSNLRTQKILRSPEEILRDLAKALGEVMRDRGSKTVSYRLDAEAMQSLMGDERMVALLSELVMMMAYINISKKEGERTHYEILLSGKGKPVVEYNQSTSIQAETVNFQFEITILPPAAPSGGQPE